MRLRKGIFMQKHKKDAVLVITLLAIALAGALANHVIRQKPAHLLEISIDGKAVQTLSLDQDTDLVIEGFADGRNHLIIKEGSAYISEASCPDKVCIRQGKISQNGEMIVCLPNRMTAQVIAGDGDRVDR